MENIRERGYKDCEILPYALNDTEGTRTFLVSGSDSMAGSLTDRRRVAGDKISEIEVECRRLSLFLQEPVHFLKLDIEGSEDAVLSEAGELLQNIQHIFCEYHHGGGLKHERLAIILTVLEKAGFDTLVGKSFSTQIGSSYRPMSFVDRPYSAVIWAKNRNWR